MHRESKSELTDRLRREGRFDAFKKRREELKAEGVPAKQAWFQAAVEFPPSVEPASNGNAPSVDLTPLKGKPAVPVSDAASWVFEHLDDDWTNPADAPCLGAWSLRNWARTNIATRSEFYRMFMNRLPKSKQKHTKAVAPEIDEDREAEMRRRLFGEPPAHCDGVDTVWRRKMGGDSS